MPTGVQSHEGEIATALHFSNLCPPYELIALWGRCRVIGGQDEIFERNFVEGFLAGPFESFGPSVVAEPVADEVGIALRVKFVSVKCRENGVGVVGPLKERKSDSQHRQEQGSVPRSPALTDETAASNPQPTRNSD